VTRPVNTAYILTDDELREAGLRRSAMPLDWPPEMDRMIGQTVEIVSSSGYPDRIRVRDSIGETWSINQGYYRLEEMYSTDDEMLSMYRRRS